MLRQLVGTYAFAGQNGSAFPRPPLVLQRPSLTLTATLAAPEARRHSLLAFAVAWSWLFFAGQLAFFEFWAWTRFGSTFVLNPFNIQSITVTAAMPLLLASGQTLVIIACGIDLSVGFVLELAWVVIAPVMQTTDVLSPTARRRLRIVRGIGVVLRDARNQAAAYQRLQV